MLQKFLFFSPCKYSHNETKAAMVVAEAMPMCPKGDIKIMAKTRLVNKTIAEYLTGVLVSPRAKKLGANALTKT